jgi:hypothetical protein
MAEGSLVDGTASGRERHDREKHRTEVTEVTEGDLRLDGGRFGKHHGLQQLTPMPQQLMGGALYSRLIL